MAYCKYKLQVLMISGALSGLSVLGSNAWGIDSRFLLDPMTLEQRQVKPAPVDETATKKPVVSATSQPVPVPIKSGLQKSAGGKTLAKRTLPRKVKSTKTGTQFGLIREERSFVHTLRQFWPQLIPAQPFSEPRVDVEARNYSLSLDPERFPTLGAADGGKIIIDAGGNIPQLVKSLLLSQDNNVRIVSESSANRHYFFRSLLTASKFFSVEENYSVDFGNDPQLIVSADYRIEKSQESLFKQELTLLNVREGLLPMPPSLVSFLGNEGFQVLEPFADQRQLSAKRGELVQILEKDFKNIADNFMQVVDLQYEKDRRIELFNFKESGIALQVKVDRYFEMAGDHFVVSFFEGDPVSYTLTRMLETKGYRVIILEGKDGLSRVAEKFLAKLRLPGKYFKQELWPSSDYPYSVQLSGVMFRQKESGQELFITDRELDPLIVDLVDGNGFRIIRF